MSVDPYRLRKHSLVIAGHKTSVTLEDAFWSALKAIAADSGMSTNGLASEIDRDRHGNLSSAIRVFVLVALSGTQPSETTMEGSE
jgi:predicted DNA-binding ribbon-helix-helix protein